jgi:acyl-CoA dehydrogenase
MFPDAHHIRQVALATDRYQAELELPGEKSPWIDYVRGLRAEGLYHL